MAKKVVVKTPMYIGTIKDGYDEIIFETALCDDSNFTLEEIKTQLTEEFHNFLGNYEGPYTFEIYELNTPVLTGKNTKSIVWG